MRSSRTLLHATLLLQAAVGCAGASQGSTATKQTLDNEINHYLREAMTHHDIASLALATWRMVAPSMNRILNPLPWSLRPSQIQI